MLHQILQSAFVGDVFCIALSLSLVVSCTLQEGVQVIFSFFRPDFVGSGPESSFPAQKPAGVCPGWRPEVERKLLFDACR